MCVRGGVGYQWGSHSRHRLDEPRRVIPWLMVLPQSQPSFRPAGSVLHYSQYFVKLPVVLIGGLKHRWVNPHGLGHLGYLGNVADEPLGMQGVGDIQYMLPGLELVRSTAVMNIFRSYPSQRGMMMRGVVPREEVHAEYPCIFEATEAFREFWAVLEGLELTLGEGIIVENVWPLVCLRYTQIDKQLGHAFGTHRGAAVRMQRQLFPVIPCLTHISAINRLAKVVDSRTPHHPAHGVPAKDIQDDVQIKVRPLH